MKTKKTTTTILSILLFQQISNAAIEQQAVRKITQLNQEVIIAIIDTGADIKHPYLQQQIWTNPGESGFDKNGLDKSTNGIDDDGNGYIDDVHGWNFVENSPRLIDRHGHGTHIAGIIRAQNQDPLNQKNIKLMILKYFDPKFPKADTLEGTIQAIRYAIQMKAQIINFSGGGSDKSSLEKAAIESAQRAGILVVAAAGNESNNSDDRGFYPADYELDNILSITATNNKQEILPTSNYGQRTVHFATNGQNIYSSLPGGKFGQMTGTSQATAVVSGLAANLLTTNDQKYDYHQLIEKLKKMSVHPATITGKTKFNAYLSGLPVTAQSSASPVQ